MAGSLSPSQTPTTFCSVALNTLPGLPLSERYCHWITIKMLSHLCCSYVDGYCWRIKSKLSKACVIACNCFRQVAFELFSNNRQCVMTQHSYDFLNLANTGELGDDDFKVWTRKTSIMITVVIIGWFPPSWEFPISLIHSFRPFL